MNWLWVFFGGGLGSVARFALSKAFPWTPASGFPTATFVSNFAACAIMGMALLFLKGKSTETWQVLLLTGFCGGFSTFSTFSLETVRLIENQFYITAALNVVISIVSCFVILFLLLKSK